MGILAILEVAEAGVARTGGGLMGLVAHGRSGLVAVGASVVAGYVGYLRWRQRGSTAHVVA